MRPSVLVFDVNETLLDLSPMRSAFEEVLGTAEPLGEWFARLLHGSLLANALDDYRRFGTIGVEALVGVAARRGIDLTNEDAREVVKEIRSLPPHPDVEGGLARLRNMDLRLATLTNGDPDAVEAQLRHAGIRHHFEAALSIEMVRRFKPDPAPYREACRFLDAPAEAAMLVAAHDWDVAGAARTGMRTAFITRPGVRWGLPGIPPDLTATDIDDLATTLAGSSVD